MKQVKKQKGFTIIELVVVILLLGILTATALPRFMDVTDEAHDAVVTGVLSGLQTSSGLFREKWDERRGNRTYGQRTIDFAIEGCTEVYAMNGSAPRRSPASPPSGAVEGTHGEGPIPLGEHDPASARLVLSPKLD